MHAFCVLVTTMAFIEGVFREDALSNLPESVDDESQEHYMSLFRQFSLKELGMAKFYVANHNMTVFTTSVLSGAKDVRRSDESIFVFETSVAIWVQKDFKSWSVLISEWLLRHHKDIWDYVNQNLREEMEDDPKSACTAAWRACRSILSACGSILTSRNSMTALADTIFTLLRADDAAQRFNSKKNILAFRNGNVNLLTRDLVPRVADDFISCFIDMDYDPEADMRPAALLLRSYFPERVTCRCARLTLGCWITSDTPKAFWQIIAKPNAGKTSFKTLLKDCFGPYFSDDVAFNEWFMNNRFQDDLAAQLSDPSRCIRILWLDDFPGETDELNAGVINTLTSGGRVFVRLARKHKGSSGTIPNVQVHVVFSGNTELRFPLHEEGTMLRCTGFPFTRRFLKPAEKAPFVPWETPSVELKQSFVRYIVESAHEYLNNIDPETRRPVFPTCAAFRLSTAQLHIASSPYLMFLTTHYALSYQYTVPPGAPPYTGRISYQDMARDLERSKMYPKYLKDAVHGFREACTAMDSVLFECTWMEDGQFKSGVAGMRARRVDDLSWVDQMELATFELEQQRQHLAALHVHVNANVLALPPPPPPPQLLPPPEPAALE